MDPNKSQNTADEDNLLDEFDISSISSDAGIDMKEMAGKIRKLEANQFGGLLIMQIGEKFGALNKEMDELKAANREGIRAFEELKEKTAKMNEEFVGKNAESKEEMDKMKAEIIQSLAKENEDLKKKVSKLAKENGEMKAAKDEEKTEIEELKATMAKMKEEFSMKNNEFERKKLQEQKADNGMGTNLSGRIDGIDFVQMKNNKWNVADCGPEFAISEGGLVVKHFDPKGYSCIRAILPISLFNLNATKPSIAGYFEVQIIDKNPYRIIQIGFCTQQFPFEGKILGYEKNSIGIYKKNGMHIDGQFNKFGNNADGDFNAGDVLGAGIIHSPANKLMKCFATLNGQLLGTFELPDKFASIQLFPAATIYYGGDKIRANFGAEKWLFDPIKILQ